MALNVDLTSALRISSFKIQIQEGFANIKYYNERSLFFTGKNQKTIPAEVQSSGGIKKKQQQKNPTAAKTDHFLVGYFQISDLHRPIHCCKCC